MRSSFILWVVSAALVAVCPVQALSAVVDFESFSDLDLVTTEIPGLSFANTTVLSAGPPIALGSLNVAEFPPHSGLNVATGVLGPSGNTEPITITFGALEATVGGFFNYGGRLTIHVTGPGGMTDVMSAFNSNLAMSGDATSSPNEFLQVGLPGGITQLTIGAAGAEFTLDDLTFSPLASTPVPWPATLPLVGGGVFILFLRGMRRTKT